MIPDTALHNVELAHQETMYTGNKSDQAQETINKIMLHKVHFNSLEQWSKSCQIEYT